MSNTQKLVLEGPCTLVKGFVHGLLHGHPAQYLFWAEEEGYATTSFVEQVSEWIGLKEHLSHLIVDGSSAQRIVEGLEQGSDLPIRLRRQVEVSGGSFEFSYEVFAPIYAKKVRDILDSATGAVTLEGFEPSVERHPEAKGDELYSPDHHWAERAQAKVTGTFPDIGVLFRACADEELIRNEALSILTIDP